MTVAKSKEKSKGQSYVLTQDRGPEDRNSVIHAETSCTLPFFLGDGRDSTMRAGSKSGILGTQYIDSAMPRGRKEQQ